jgi:sec-independent protein translocase protein TatA
MFEINNFQVLILAVLAVLLFGNRLPEIMRSVGKGIAQFRRGLEDMQNDAKDSKKPDEPNNKK